MRAVFSGLPASSRRPAARNSAAAHLSTNISGENNGSDAEHEEVGEPGAQEWRFAGRNALGRPSPTTFSINGVYHVRHNTEAAEIPGAIVAPPKSLRDWALFARPLNKEGKPARRGTTESVMVPEHTMVVGAACSTCFSGKNLAKILQPGFEFERRAMDSLHAGWAAPPLSIHTSAGTSSALGGFIHALSKHLPWSDCPTGTDWFVSLQVEGASAVMAACDLLLQIQAVEGNVHRTMVAVGAYSYHGPQSTSMGSGTPMIALKPRNQVHFPVPAVFAQREDEDTTAFHQRILAEYEQFLDEHADTIGVMLVEPQWGSSVAGQPWAPELLRTYIRMAQERGILVCCDEIMCGLHRHGQGPGLFVSDHRNWDLQPDAVCFGKAIGAGVYPMSGCIVRQGAHKLGAEGRSVLQSHTYSGASTRALMAGEAVLDEVGNWASHVAEMGPVCREVFDGVEAASKGTVRCHGQGLMWGGLFQFPSQEAKREAVGVLKRHCATAENGVWPYFVPAGGFMISPPLDTHENALREMGRRLERAVAATEAEITERGLATE